MTVTDLVVEKLAPAGRFFEELQYRILRKITKGFAAYVKFQKDEGTDRRGLHVTCSFSLPKEHLKPFCFTYRPPYVRGDGSSRR